MESNKEWNYETFRENQRSFRSSDGKISYVDEGSGNVILLLHGVPSSSWVYRKMIDQLVENGNRVVAPDMLGFGNSDNPDEYEVYAPDQHAKRILELMDSLKIRTWTHVMHDAGGHWTWELLRKDPDRISKLVLLNTIVFEEGFNPPIKMKPGAFSKFSMWLYKNGVTTNVLLKQLFKEGLKKENQLSKAEIEGYKMPLLEGKTNGMYYFFTRTCSTFPNYEPVIDSIDIPTIVIWGKHDRMLQLTPQKDKIMKRLKVNPENMHFIDAKHFIQEEMPQEINSLILGFIKVD